MSATTQPLSPDARRPAIPAHILWPGMVVTILLMSVLAHVIFILKASQDNGAQIEEDYYKQAVGWDAQHALQVQSDALRWEATFDLTGAAGGSVEVQLHGADGAPVEGLRGALSARHASQAHPQEAALEPVPGAPGRYRAPVVLGRPGLWDLTLDVERGAERFIHTARQELRP